MFEFFDWLIFLERIPTSRVNVAPNTLNIKYTFYSDKNVSFETNIINVVIPTRMFAKCSNKHSFEWETLSLWNETSDEFFNRRVQ